MNESGRTIKRSSGRTSTGTLGQSVSVSPISKMRTRYFVAVSLLYLVLGAVIMVRSVLAHTQPLIILGIVFLALGLVRLRDYNSRRQTR